LVAHSTRKTFPCKIQPIRILFTIKRTDRIRKARLHFVRTNPAALRFTMKFRALGLLAFAAVLLACEPAGAGDPTGLWRSESGLSRYRVRYCGQGICVKIDWIVEGPEVRDVNNPDPALRSRRVMGIDIISKSKPAGKDRWTGEIYNFKNGQTYIGKAELIDRNHLRVAGCVLGGLICISQNLYRLE
jgi:uncharacterized protein (DUF2147 family)